MNEIMEVFTRTTESISIYDIGVWPSWKDASALFVLDSNDQNYNFQNY